MLEEDQKDNQVSRLPLGRPTYVHVRTILIVAMAKQQFLG